MNAVDLHKLPPPGETLKTRLEYNRSKTMSRRGDEAFMSVNIPNIAMPLYLKYEGTLSSRYSNHITLDQALAKGMKGLSKLTKIPDLEFYDLRHAFADIARNTLNFHKDDIAEALNHNNSTNAVIDTYLARSWGIVDKIQNAVIALLQGKVTKQAKKHELSDHAVY
jgi:integrase